MANEHDRTGPGSSEFGESASDGDGGGRSLARVAGRPTEGFGVETHALADHAAAVRRGVRPTLPGAEVGTWLAA